MAVNLTRVKWIFMRGKRIPIRIGADVRPAFFGGLKSVSSEALKKTSILEKSGFKITKKGNLLAPFKSESGTDSMQTFMRKTGMIRFSTLGPFAHLETAPTTAQRRFFTDFTDSINHVQYMATKKGKYLGEVFGDFQEDFMRKLGNKLSIFRPTKTGREMAHKAESHFGTTENMQMGGFLTREGKMLDFSGNKFGARTRGRELDHREVSQFVSNQRPRAKSKDIVKALKEWKYNRIRNNSWGKNK